MSPDRATPPASKGGYRFASLLAPSPAAPGGEEAHSGASRPSSPDASATSTRRWQLALLVVGALALGTIGIFGLSRVRGGETGSSDELGGPLIPTDTCTTDGFESLLPASESDGVEEVGKPRCDAGFAVVHLTRSNDAGSGSDLAVFRAGYSNSWEHFATVSEADCQALPQIEAGFPPDLCLSPQ